MAKAVRTFIAIELPQEVREYLESRQTDLANAGGDVKWVRTDDIHLTLVFLGNVPVEEIAAVAAAVRGAAASMGPIRLRAGGAGCFPPHGRPRVVWIGIEEPTGALARLQGAVAGATERFAEKPERREYKAHLTVGRVRGGRGAEELSEAVAALADAKGPEFEAAEVVIFESVLAREGPMYMPLARVPFGTPV
ncbi:MAG: RNA 2',3'-cyclic phosphodiesterase [Planctomycetota bacterium]|nr:RNA 2',3'-cyclic phosphodiesterase [Planctomycetota bacterium]